MAYVFPGKALPGTTTTFYRGDGAFSNAVSRLSVVTGVATISTSANDDGAVLSAIPFGCNYGQIARLRLWADQNMAQRTTGQIMINAAAGIDPATTTLPYDGLIGTLPTAGAEGTGDYIWIDGELCRVSAGTSSPLTIVRGLCGTKSAFHDDNSYVRTANEGLHAKLYSANAETYPNLIFDITGKYLYVRRAVATEPTISLISYGNRMTS